MGKHALSPRSFAVSALEREIARFAYRPGWQFAVYVDEYLGPVARIAAEGGEVSARIPPQVLEDPAQLGRWLLWRLTEVEVNEAREFLKRDGQLVSGPQSSQPQAPVAPGAGAAPPRRRFGGIFGPSNAVLQHELLAVQQQLAAVQAQLSDMSDTLGSLMTDQSHLDAQVTALQAALTDIGNQVTAVQGQNTQLAADATSLAAEIAALKVQNPAVSFDGLDALVTSVAATQQSLDTAVAGLGSAVQGITAQAPPPPAPPVGP